MADETLDWGKATRLDALEALFWRAEADPHLRSTIVGVEVLDRAPDWERFRAAHEWGSRMVPRFRMRVTEPALGLAQPIWVTDDAFDVDVHVRRLRLPEGASEQGLFDEAARIGMTPFDRHRSPWEATLVEGLPGGRAGYVLKLHHSATDGIGSIQLLKGLHSPTRESVAGKPQPPVPARVSTTTWQALLDQAGRDVGGVAGALRGTAARLLRPDRALRDGLRFGGSLQRVLGEPEAAPSPLLAGRSLRWAFFGLDVPFAALRGASKAVGGTLNDAFLAALLGGFRRYHEELGTPIDVMPLAIPISTRKEGETGGNKFAAARLAGPVGLADPAARMAAVGALVKGARSEPALDAASAVAPLIARLPGPLVAKVAGPMTRGNDLQASNVPGIREDAYLAGAKVERLYPYAPLPGCASMICLVTHGATCCVGINLDPAAITEPARFARCVAEGFDEVLALGPDGGTAELRS